MKIKTKISDKKLKLKTEKKENKGTKRQKSCSFGGKNCQDVSVIYIYIYMFVCVCVE